MRQERTIQATIFDVFAQHEIGCELKAMSQWLDGQRQLISLVAGDLRRQGVRETGRRGLTAESVLRCALLKQQRQLSYEELAFHLEDSSSFRAFARLPLRWSPKKSVLHHDRGDSRRDLGGDQSSLVGQRQTRPAGKRRHSAARQHSDRGSDARAQRQHAVIRCGTGHDPAVAARCGAAGDAGGAMARSAAPDQEAGPRHRVQPRAGQKASALSRADRRCRGQPRRTEIFFAYEHLREDLQGVSRHFHALAHHLAEVVPEGPEETVLLGTVTPEL